MNTRIRTFVGGKAVVSAFVGGEEVSIITNKGAVIYRKEKPETYTFVKALVGDGVASIDTGVQLTEKMELVALFRITNPIDKRKIPFGVWDDPKTGGTGSRQQLVLDPNGTDTKSTMQYNGGNNTSFVPKIGEQYSINLNYGRGTINWKQPNETSYYLSPRNDKAFRTHNTAFIFGNGTNPTANFDGEIYEFRIVNWETNEDLIKLIPAVRDSDGVAGMYDVISDKFLTPAEGSFGYIEAEKSIKETTEIIFDENTGEWKVLFASHWETATIQVFNSRGRLAKTFKDIDTKSDFVIEFPSASGVYYVKVSNNEEITINKKIEKA